MQTRRGGNESLTKSSTSSNPTMMMPRPATNSLLKVSPSLITGFSPRKRLRRLLLQIRLLRFHRSPFAFILPIVLLIVALALFYDPVSPNGETAITDAIVHPESPLSADEFAAAVSHLSNSSRKPLLSDPTLVRNGINSWARKSRDPKLPPDDWDDIADDVAIAVKTGSEVARKRLGYLRTQGWLSVGRRIPNIIVVADAAIPDIGVVDVKRYAADVVVGALRSDNGTNSKQPKRWFDRSGWRGDKDKNLPTLHLLRSTFPKAKWYILLDDDTYLFLDNFARYAAKAPENTAIYTGKVFYISNCGPFQRSGAPKPGTGITHRGLFAHGGGGIFINSLAMNRIYGRIDHCVREYSSCWAGDMQVGLCMNDAGVQVHNFKNGHSHEYMFTPFWPSRAMADSRYTRRLRSRMEPVTFHKIPTAEAALVARFDLECALNRTRVQYTTLREFLQSNGVQPTFGWRPTRYDTRVFWRE